MDGFKKLIAILVSCMILVSSHAAPAEGGGGALPDWVFKGFDQAAVNVSFVVNDILYAGFSSNAIKKDHMAPVSTQLKPIEFMTTSSQTSYYSDAFFIYAIASTKAKIHLELTFPDLSKKGVIYTDPETKLQIGGHNYLSNAADATGLMYTDMTGAVESIPVHLEGTGPLPYRLEVTTGGTGVQNVAISNPPEQMLRLRVDKKDMGGEVNGTYHTVLQLTAVIE